jgi:CheY-like chemotaxis protein
LKLESLQADFCVVGGGLAGVCAAITAARAGLRVVLLQDRPVLGGNASSEVRLWANGATAHMGLNNRFAREGGLIDEILLENLWRNPEGNPVIFDTVLLDKVAGEPSLTLLLNTAVFSCDKSNPDRISTVRGIIGASHGFTTLETAPGRGTTIRAYLPVAPADARRDSNVIQSPVERGNNELVLLVDDEQSIRDIGEAILAHAGYRVITATNGEEALALFTERAAEVSLVITDLDMPRMGGEALSRAIRALNPALKIMAMSGISDRYSKDRPCDFASAFIGKPFAVDELLTQLQRLLRGTVTPTKNPWPASS